MPIRPYISEWMEEERDTRIEDLERRVRELEERLEQITLGLTVDAAGSVTILGPTLNVESATARFDAPMVTCSGVLQCTTLQATTVVAASYTPGAGNIM
jgi:hypothetical protein